MGVPLCLISPLLFCLTSMGCSASASILTAHPQKTIRQYLYKYSIRKRRMLQGIFQLFLFLTRCKSAVSNRPYCHKFRQFQTARLAVVSRTRFLPLKKHPNSCLSGVVDVCRRGLYRVNQPAALVHAEMRLAPKAPGIPLLDLMSLRIPLLLPVPGGRGRRYDDGIHDRPLLQNEAALSFIAPPLNCSGSIRCPALRPLCGAENAPAFFGGVCRRIP